jgi:hypothetical protein
LDLQYSYILIIIFYLYLSYLLLYSQPKVPIVTKAGNLACPAMNLELREETLVGENYIRKPTVDSSFHMALHLVLFLPALPNISPASKKSRIHPSFSSSSFREGQRGLLSGREREVQKIAVPLVTSIQRLRNTVVFFSI